MKLILAWIVSVPLASGLAQAADGLFDGKSLKGWRQVNGSAPYEVIDGEIVGTTRMGTPNSFLATEKLYGDFVLEFEVKQSVGPTNSGVQFRSQSKPEVMQGRVHGPQLDLDPSERQWTGGIYDEAASGWWYPSTLNPQPGLYKFDAWNRIRIEAIGPSMRTWVNGVLTAYVIDPSYSSGFIALQVHSIDKPEEAGRKIHWRNLRINERAKPSPAEANIFVRNTVPNDLSDVERKQGWRLLWDGRSAKGWSFPTQGWQIKNGEITVTGGGSDLVTEDSYGPFELQMEFQLTPGAKSGIKYHGLEYQLVDDDGDPDAKQTKDSSRSLASLYDVQPRAALMGNLGVAPKAGRWQHARIISRSDGTIEHWLNGVMVLKYSRGSELVRSPILLQNEGQEIRFRSVKIKT